MKWLWKSSSGKTPTTVVSETVKLIEEQRAYLQTDGAHPNGSLRFKKKILYSVYYLQTLDDGYERTMYRYENITSKKEVEAMYNHLMENRGQTTFRKTIKEKLIKVE